MRSCNWILSIPDAGVVKSLSSIPILSQQSRRERAPATRSGQGQLEIPVLERRCHSIDFCFSYPDVGSDVAPRYDAGAHLGGNGLGLIQFEVKIPGDGEGKFERRSRIILADRSR